MEKQSRENQDASANSQHQYSLRGTLHCQSEAVLRVEGSYMSEGRPDQQTCQPIHKIIRNKK